MKKTLLAALAAISLMSAATPAMAWDGHRGHGRGHDRHDRWDNNRHHGHSHRHHSSSRVIINTPLFGYYDPYVRYYTVAQPIYYTPRVYHRHFRGCGHW